MTTFTITTRLALPYEDQAEYDGLMDDVTERLMSTYGGKLTEASFEDVTIPCVDCGEDHEQEVTPGRVLVFEFECESDDILDSWVIDAFDACKELRGSVEIELSDEDTLIESWNVMEEIQGNLEDSDWMADPIPDLPKTQLN